MSAKTRLRGHKIVFDQETEVWRYRDSWEVVDALTEKPCVRCGGTREDGVDPCLGVLDGVTAACCGHGYEEDAYLVFENGTVLRGGEAIEKLEELRKGVRKGDI